jgi:RNA polymerase sigma-70 factor (ECF subfamily)
VLALFASILARFRPNAARDQKAGAAPPLLEVNAGLAVQASDLSFADIFRDHAPYLWRALLGLGVRQADVDDVCQEVWLVVHRRLREFDGRAVRSWLYAICLRVASEYRRSARIRRELVVAEVPETVALPGQHTSLSAREDWLALLRVLDELDEQKRNAFVLYEIEELSLREVAEIVGCPLQTAYSRVNAARSQVQARFASKEER